MSALTFLWHDYETFGANPRSDRPAQFAAIRTDADLNEIGEPLMWYCLPTSDYVPDPVSCLITGITPQTCLEKGVPEPEFARLIEAELGLPGTVGVGYNSIRFDDEFTRHLLWRCLRDPYAREWQNNCGRWDLLDVVRLVYALRPEGMAWPKKPDGSPSFKLEDLSRANGIAHISAHDALSDVRATIGLARLIKQVQPKLFDFALKLRDKRQVAQELGWPVDVGQAKPFLHVSAGYGVGNGNIALVWPLMTHPTNKNDVIVWDLRHDPRELLSLDAETLRRRWFGKKDQLLEGETRLPLHTISMNKSPMVVGNLRVLSESLADRWHIDLGLTQQHAAFAQTMPDVSGVFAQVLVKPSSPAGDAEQDLYGGFVSREDRATLNHLLATPIDSPRWQTPAFEDERLDDLVFRYRARHHEATLTPEEQARWSQIRVARLIAGASGARTAQTMFDRIDELMETAEDQGNEAHMAILDALYDYGQAITPDWSDD